MHLLGMDRMDEERSIERQPTEAAYIDPYVKKTHRDEGTWLHGVVGTEANVIRTPLTSELPGRVENTYGYGFEILLSRQKRQWEYELGLGYNFFSYTPHSIYASPQEYQSPEGIYSVEFSQVSLQHFSAPVRVKYHFVDNGRWSVFGGMGIHNDVISSIDYAIEDSPVIVMPTCQGCPSI